MVQGTGISLGRIALVIAALGALLLWAASSAHGAPGGAGIALLVDDCQSFTDLPPAPGSSQAMAPRVTWHGVPAARLISALWVEHRAPAPPLRGTGSDWIFVPFGGCGGIDTGDFDLRNPSGKEAVHGARDIAIAFHPAAQPCAPAATASVPGPCALKPRPPIIAP